MSLITDVAHLLFFVIIQVLKDCGRKHATNDSEFATLSDAILERVRNAVGEAHWAQALQIHKQILINQHKDRALSGHKHEPNTSLVNADISVPRRGKLRRVKKRKKSRSPTSAGKDAGGSIQSENSDTSYASSYTSTSSLTTSGNEKYGSATSSAPSSSSTNPSGSENDNNPRDRESSSCSSGD